MFINVVIFFSLKKISFCSNLFHSFLFIYPQFYFISFLFIFCYFSLVHLGYPPPLKNMLNNMNGSNLANHIGGNNPADPLSNSQTPSSSGGSLSQKKTCPYCYQQLSWHALSRHIRDMHKAKTNFVTCKHCQKMFRNKNSLGCHMWRFHKEAKDKDANNKDSGAMETNLKVLDHESVKDNSNAGPLLE